MGEMADYDLEHLYDGDEGDGWEEEDEWETVTCLYCKRSDLTWSRMMNGWRITESNGKIHKCPAFKFDDIEWG